MMNEIFSFFVVVMIAVLYWVYLSYGNIVPISDPFKPTALGTQRIQVESGYFLHEIVSLPKNKINTKALVILVHGLGEHIGRYEKFIQSLNENNYAVYAYDHRGHGHSSGRRCNPNAHEVSSDLIWLLENRIPQIDDIRNLPKFIYAHSLGGLATLEAMTSPNLKFSIFNKMIKGAVLCSMPFDVPNPLAKEPFISVVRWLGRVLPSLPLAPPIDGALLSRDVNIAESYKSDPMVCKEHVSAFTAGSMAEALKVVQSNAHNVNIPVIVFHGEKDQIAAVGPNLREINARFSSKDKDFRIRDGAYHELCNELDKEAFIKELITWYDRHLE